MANGLNPCNNFKLRESVEGILYDKEHWLDIPEIIAMNGDVSICIRCLFSYSAKREAKGCILAARRSVVAFDASIGVHSATFLG